MRDRPVHRWARGAPGGARSRPCGAAQRSCAGSGPLPRAGAQLPVHYVLLLGGVAGAAAAGLRRMPRWGGERVVGGVLPRISVGTWGLCARLCLGVFGGPRMVRTFRFRPQTTKAHRPRFETLVRTMSLRDSPATSLHGSGAMQNRE